MRQSLLVQDITLGFPLPDDDLAGALDCQTNPSAGLIDADAADFVVADAKGLDFGQLFFQQLIDRKLPIAVGSSHESCFGIVEESLKVGSRLGNNQLLRQNESPPIHIFLKFGVLRLLLSLLLHFLVYFFLVFQSFLF